MKSFRFDATVLDPPGLPDEARASFESAIQSAGAFDMRISGDAEGRTRVSFVISADGERDAMKLGSDITLSALSDHSAIRWVASGVTHWREG